LEPANILGFKALQKRREADLSWTFGGTAEMQIAASKPVFQESRRDFFANAVARQCHRFHIGATDGAPGHECFAPVHHQQAFGFYRDLCPSHHNGYSPIRPSIPQQLQ
jgi:hypothetical protein